MFRLRKCPVERNTLIQSYSKNIKSISQSNNDKTKISKYEFNDNRIILQKNSEPFSISQKMKNIFHYFLPQEYPHSVKENYLIYCKWSAVQYTSSSICGVLATKSLLYSVGVGSASIPLAAAMNWILKDGLGQLGTILFASKISTNFDSNPKKWRLISEIVLGFACILEIITTLFPNYFLIMASIANIGKNISFLSSSASRVTMNKSFAKRDNLGDVTGKAASQTILASTIGTSIGVLISPFLSMIQISYNNQIDDINSVLFAFLFLYSLQIFSVFKAVSYVEINSFNLQKVELLFEHYFETNEILSPTDISKIEKILFYQSKIKVNENLKNIVNSKEEILNSINQFQNEKFLILKKGNIIFFEDANTYDVLKGIFYALKHLKNERENEFNFDQFFERLKQTDWNLEIEHIEHLKDRISVEYFNETNNHIQ
eukprot:gene5112-8710_t